MSLRDHGRALRDAAARLAASPMASLLSVLVIAVALSLPVGLYVGLSYLQSFSRQLSSDPQISIFLALDASSRDAAGVEERLRSDPDALRHGFARLYVPRNDGRRLRLNALVAAGNVGGDGERDAVAGYLDDPDESTRELAAWTLARLEERDA